MGPSTEALWYETRTALDRLFSSAVSFTATYCNVHDASDSIPIFVIHVTYQVACIYLRLAPGMTDGENRDKIEPFKQLLRLIDSRWRLAGKKINEDLLCYHVKANLRLLGVYLKILEAQEITASSDAFVMR